MWPLVLLVLVPLPAFADALVATRLIRATEVVRAGDVAVQRGQLPGVASDPVQVVGLEARVAIYPGRPLRLADLAPAAVIERNETVTMLYRPRRSGTIRSEGRALGARGTGRYGDGDEPCLAPNRCRAVSPASARSMSARQQRHETCTPCREGNPMRPLILPLMCLPLLACETAIPSGARTRFHRPRGWFRTCCPISGAVAR